MVADLSPEGSELLEQIGAAYRQAESLGRSGDEFVVHPYWDGLHNYYRLVLPDGCEPREIQTVKPALDELRECGLLARVQAGQSASALTPQGLAAIGA